MLNQAETIACPYEPGGYTGGGVATGGVTNPDSSQHTSQTKNVPQRVSRTDLGVYQAQNLSVVLQVGGHQADSYIL